MLRLEYRNYTLDFKFEAGTSRGVLKKHPIYLLKVWDSRNPAIVGYGEAAPLERLSIDSFENLGEPLAQLSENVRNKVIPTSAESALKLAAELVNLRFPSLRFGFETALLDLINGGNQIILRNEFSGGKSSIPINGLIWMGDTEFMKKQIDEKVDAGFTCIKLKVGAIDFEEELKIVSYLRSKGDDLIIRLDANGGFPTNEVFSRLSALRPYNIHSIEQPIMPKQPEATSLICQKSPIPIALDEELIGVTGLEKKRELLTYLKPKYIILKPTLLGGFAETQEWIDLANSLNIGWWITSALESNVGLNAISQFTGEFQGLSYQGLGTGQLYDNNFLSPLSIHAGHLSYDQTKKWQPIF